MLAVSPAADFRGRVLARIEERPRRTIWTRAAWTAAAAAVLAAVLLRDAPAPAPAPLLETVEKAAPSASITPSPVSAPSDSARAAVPRRLGPARRTSAPVPSTFDDVPQIEVAEIVVAPPVTLEEIEPPEIVIPPLPEPAEVAVEPLPFPRDTRK